MLARQRNPWSSELHPTGPARAVPRWTDKTGDLNAVPATCPSCQEQTQAEVLCLAPAMGSPRKGRFCIPGWNPVLQGRTLKLQGAFSAPSGIQCSRWDLVLQVEPRAPGSTQGSRWGLALQVSSSMVGRTWCSVACRSCLTSHAWACETMCFLFMRRHSCLEGEMPSAWLLRVCEAVCETRERRRETKMEGERHTDLQSLRETERLNA